MTLHLHYWPTPNGKKVTIFLEEANLPYEVVPCNIGRGDQVSWQGQEQNIDEFPYFKRWFEDLGQRPALQRGLAVGKDFSNDPATLSPEETERRAKLLYNQRARPTPVKR